MAAFATTVVALLRLLCTGANAVLHETRPLQRRQKHREPFGAPIGKLSRYKFHNRPMMTGAQLVCVCKLSSVTTVSSWASAVLLLHGLGS
jgi:hypothetical protein